MTVRNARYAAQPRTARKVPVVFAYLDDATAENYALLVERKVKLRTLDRRARGKQAHRG